MAKKRKRPNSEPSRAYLISFGDTMTALLAFFIVINSMAKEQTGADLYSGTGSFVSSLRAFGIPGKWERPASKHVFQKTDVNPLYVVDDRLEKDKKENVKANEGPDEEANPLRVINRQRDSLRRFLIEMEQLGKTEQLPQTSGLVMFDIFEPIESTSPVISENATDVFRRAATLANRGNYQIDIVVWARTPGVTTWKKATMEAEKIRKDLFQRLGVPSRVRSCVSAQGKPWFYRDERRPRFSFAVRKISD